MVSYNYSFSTGEVGIGNSNAYGNDRSIDLLVAENLLPDDRYNWNPRGGSQFVDTVDQAQEWLQNQEYTIIKFEKLIKIYSKNKLQYYIEYSFKNNIPEDFAIGGIMVNTKVGYKNNESFDCVVGFSVYKRENFLSERYEGGTFSKLVTNNLQVKLFDKNGRVLTDTTAIDTDARNYLCIGVVTGKPAVQITAVKIGAVESGFTDQIVDMLSWCGQTITLSIRSDFSMALYFSSPIGTTSGSTDSSFKYGLSVKAGYQNIIKYNSGFIIWGLHGAVGFYTSTQTQNAVFEANNVRGDLFIFESAVEDLTSYDNFCCLKPIDENGIRLIYLTYPLRNNSTSFYLPHTTATKIRSIDVIKDYQIRFLVLYVDGTIDVITLFQGDNNNYIYLVSRLSFYDYVGRIIGTNGSKFWFFVNQDYQMLDFNSSIYLDNYSDFSIPFTNINPISYNYNLGTLKNIYGEGIFGNFPIQFPTYTFRLDANANVWSAVVCQVYFDIFMCLQSNTYALYLDTSVLNNGRKITLILDIQYLARQNSSSKNDFTLSVYFGSSSKWTRVTRTSFSYTDKIVTNKILTYEITKTTANPVSRGSDSRIISYNSPEDKYTRDLGGNIFTKPSDLDGFVGYTGYLIPYKFVYFDPIMQGNLLYGMPKSSVCFNWKMFGKSVAYNNISELYVNADYPMAKMYFPDKLNSASPPAELGGDLSDGYNSWRINNRRVAPLVEYSSGDCLFRYGSLASFEPFTVYSGNVSMMKTKNRQSGE